MNINFCIGNVLYLIILFYLILKKEKKHTKYFSLFLFTAFSEIFFNIGYSFKISNFEINYSYISLIITFLYGVKLVIKEKYKILNLVDIVLFLSIVIGILYRKKSTMIILSTDHTMISDELFMGKELIKMEITSYSYIVFAKFLIYLFCWKIFMKTYNKENLLFFIKKYSKFCKIIIVLSIIEFILNNLYSPFFVRNIILFIFGNGKSTVSVPQFRNGFYTVLLTCREPSLAMYLLFTCNLFLFADMQMHKKNNNIYIFFSSIIMILSSAITGLLLLLAFFCIILFKKYDIKKIICFSSILVIIFLFLLLWSNISFFNYYKSRFENMFKFISVVLKNPNDSSIFNNFGGSEVFRIYSIINNILCFLKTPFIGVGIGTCTCFSGIVNLLSNIGLIGFVAYIIIQEKMLIKFGNRNVEIKTFIIMIIIFLFQGGIAEMTSCFYVIWLILISTLIAKKGEEYYEK